MTDPWDDDTLVEVCGWCGHEHPHGYDCGCAPCASCGGYHGLDEARLR